LSHGFVESQGGGGVQPNRFKYFNTDSIDSCPVMNQLRAAIAEESLTYFYTQSCNQKDFYGVRELKRWIDSPKFKQILIERNPEVTVDEISELVESMAQAACVTIVSNWLEVAEICMLYVAKSSERPFGKVKMMWWRHEYQGEKGNLSHSHCLLWVDGADKDEIVNRIQGSVTELIHAEEINDLIGEGFYKSFDNILKIRDCARRFLFHHCD
jgi:hypothetical protein